MSNNKRIYCVLVNPEDTKTVKIVHIAADTVREYEEDHLHYIDFFDGKERVGHFSFKDVHNWWIESSTEPNVPKKLYDFEDNLPDPTS